MPTKLMTSFSLPTMVRKPSRSIFPRSPVLNHPSFKIVLSALPGGIIGIEHPFALDSDLPHSIGIFLIEINLEIRQRLSHGTPFVPCLRKAG